METLYRKVAGIIENAIDDFSSKWKSHIEKDSGITEYANEITNIIETETAQLQADKAELLQALERHKDALDLSNMDFYIKYGFNVAEVMPKTRVLIQKHKP